MPRLSEILVQIASSCTAVQRQVICMPRIALPRLAKYTKAGDQIKGRHKLIVAAIFEVDCCVDVGARTQAILPGDHILWEDVVQPAGTIQSLFTRLSNDLTFVTYQYYNSPFLLFFSAIIFISANVMIRLSTEVFFLNSWKVPG